MSTDFCKAKQRIEHQLRAAKGDVASHARRLAKLRYDPTPKQLAPLNRAKDELAFQRLRLREHPAKCETCGGGS